MAIDYVLGVRCEPQQRLGVERLVALNRTRILARAALAQLGDGRAPRDVSIELRTHGVGTSTDRGVTLQDLLDESAPLDAVTPACARCPAELPRELACHRRIRYPIGEHVEAWLMERLPRSLGCTAGALLVRALGDFAWDGAPAAKLRAAGDTFFASRVPYGMRWQSPDGAIELSSDQLFQMMFMVGTIQPTHALMLALFLGVIPHDIELRTLADRDARTGALAAVEVPREPDADVEQFAAFLRMLALGARLEAPIFIDA